MSHVAWRWLRRFLIGGASLACGYLAYRVPGIAETALVTIASAHYLHSSVPPEPPLFP
jgi:hypothetical protein